MNKIDLANLRREYAGAPLTKASVDPDPFRQFSVWLDEALHSEILDANAMTLSTVDENGRPSARVVLLKGFDQRGFVFFTNYKSQKARDLAANPNACLSFFWPEIHRQVMIHGTAEKTTRDESENYFKTRPIESKIGAWASEQSSVIGSRSILEEKFSELRSQYGDDIPLPPYWGGFRVVPERFEFWQGRESRLHDRICYESVDGRWKIFRLSP
jgi:pyridoxamine 5'-phosphate oxidase